MKQTGSQVHGQTDRQTERQTYRRRYRSNKIVIFDVSPKICNLFLSTISILHLHLINKLITLRHVDNYLNASICSYLDTSCGQSSNLYLKVVHFFNTGVN